jgi:NAD(P)H-hydrate repair Nnr-like enzyme with NAD(P)H-hydrate epimerase domain
MLANPPGVIAWWSRQQRRRWERWHAPSSRGCDVAAYPASPRSRITGDALARLGSPSSGAVRMIDTPRRRRACHAIAQAAVVVDGLFGIGLSRPVGPPPT